MITKFIKNFFHGLISTAEPFAIADGAFSDVLNWIQLGNKIELSRGSVLLGAVDETGTGVTGFHTAHTLNGTAVLFKKIGRKLMYLNTALEPDDWAEVGTNLFPVAAASEYVIFSNYISEAGAQVIFGSPNSSLYKIVTANPDSYADMYDAAKNYKGWIKVDNRWSWLWNFQDKGRNESDIRRSFVDRTSSPYTTVSAEALGGSGSLTYSGTLAFKAGDSKRSCFGVSITDTSETFTDPRQTGILTGSAGGTGTINYMSGAYSVTFIIAAVGSVTASYYHETSSTNGILDFTFSGTRTAGQGFLALQGKYGKLQNVFSFQNTTYGVHEAGTYKLSVSEDDLSITNLPFLDEVGIESPFGAWATENGIYYVNSKDVEDAKINKLSVDSQGNVTPNYPPISTPWKLDAGFQGIELSNYRFNLAAVKNFGDFICVSCRHKDSTYNDTVFLHDTIRKGWTRRKWAMNLLDVYSGDLVGGSSISNNAFTLFSSFTDEDINIENYVDFKRDSLELDEQVKKVTWLGVRGEIQDNQDLEVWISYDGADFVKVGEINWDGTYVDRGTEILIGTHGIGSEVIGGDDDVTAHPYQREIKVMTSRFNELTVRLIAQNIGYVSVTAYWLKNIRKCGSKLIPKFTTTS